MAAQKSGSAAEERSGRFQAQLAGSLCPSVGGTIGRTAIWTLPVLFGAELLSGGLSASIRGHPFFPDAIATLRPASGSSVSGSVAFRAEGGGVRVSADVSGLSSGEHGFHIHERGDCSAPDALSAGEHFDPIGMPHAGPDTPVRHVGDLGNLVAGPRGFARFLRFDRLLALRGPGSIVGRAVVVHESRDDLVTQPSGNAGHRVGCGVIEIVAGSRQRRALLSGRTESPWTSRGRRP